MPVPQTGSIGDVAYNGSLSAITAATVDYIPVPRSGRIKSLAVTPTAATATGSATFQIAVAPPNSSTFTNVTNALVTVASGTAQGQTVYQLFAPSVAAYIVDGSTISITAGGTATGGGTPKYTVVVGP